MRGRLGWVWQFRRVWVVRLVGGVGVGTICGVGWGGYGNLEGFGWYDLLEGLGVGTICGIGWGGYKEMQQSWGVQ